MRKTITFFIFASVIFISCKKDNSQARADCLQTPPAICSTIRCTSDGHPVCGCNNVTYSSACEAECSGVTSYTPGICP